jgi:hypothetical protein
MPVEASGEAKRATAHAPPLWSRGSLIDDVAHCLMPIHSIKELNRSGDHGGLRPKPLEVLLHGFGVEIFQTVPGCEKLVKGCATGSQKGFEGDLYRMTDEVHRGT